MTRISTPLCDLLGIEHPVIQDGMGPFRTARLAAAVSAAGGLGTVSMPGMTKPVDEGARLLREQIDEVASLTERPFAVNVPVGYAATGEVLPVTEAYIAATIAARADLGSQLVALTTSAGFPGEYTARIQAAGMVHLHKVGAVRHALKAVANGVDAVIASGYEMGGHTHETPVHTMVLAPQVAARVAVPVIVSGGIFDGRGLAAALAMGAAGVAMGTRFIATAENEWDEGYKQAIVEAPEGGDVILPGVYGPLRGLENDGARELRRIVAGGELDEAALTRWKDERMIGAQSRGAIAEGLLPAGQCAAAIGEIAAVPALLEAIVEEAAALLEGASSMVLHTVGRVR